MGQKNSKQTGTGPQIPQSDKSGTWLESTSRLHSEQQTQMTKSFQDGGYAVGAFLFFEGVLTLLIGIILTVIMGFVTVTKILLFIGVMSIVAGAMLVRQGKQFKAICMAHLSQVRPQGVTRIADVAAALKESPETAEKYLRELIRRGYFPGAFIDDDKKLLVRKVKEAAPEVCPKCGSSWSAGKDALEVCPFCGADLKK
ncbi:MAG: hypothetical protein IJL66_06180 [Lachnospiraceae bacterium]|nr:hypothetical protein [Lachnospiraceae bacterium]